MTISDYLKAYARKFLFNNPSLYYIRYRITHGYKGDEHIATISKDIVIEGPPRVANTFMVFAFKEAQPKEVSIAHHMHSPCQLIRASKLSIPAILLIREPLSTCISHTIIKPQKNLDTVHDCLYYYIDFYEALINYKKYFVIGRFEDVISNPQKIIREVNRKYSTTFDNFSVENNFDSSKIRKRIDDFYIYWGKQGNTWFDPNGLDQLKVSRPTEAKKILKANLLKQIDKDKKSQVLLNRAIELYKFFAEN